MGPGLIIRALYVRTRILYLYVSGFVTVECRCGSLAGAYQSYDNNFSQMFRACTKNDHAFHVVGVATYTSLPKLPLKFLPARVHVSRTVCIYNEFSTCTMLSLSVSFVL